MSVRPNIILETQSADTAASMAERGISACILYDSYLLAQKNRNVSIFNVGELRIPHQLVIAYSKESDLTITDKAVIKVITDCVIGMKER